MENENETENVIVIAAEGAAGCFGCVNVCVFWLHPLRRPCLAIVQCTLFCAPFRLAFPAFAQVSQTVSLFSLSVSVETVFPWALCSFGHCFHISERE